MNNIGAYEEILAIRSKLKACQQLSWDIGSIEKRYPLHQVPEEELPALLEIYRDLFERLTLLVPQPE